MIDKARGATDAWDAIWSVLDDLTTDPGLPIDVHTESGLSSIILRASDERLIDKELHIESTARWMLALVEAYRVMMAGHHSLDPDWEIATMRVIITRYLRPARPRV